MYHGKPKRIFSSIKLFSNTFELIDISRLENDNFSWERLVKGFFSLFFWSQKVFFIK